MLCLKNKYYRLFPHIFRKGAIFINNQLAKDSIPWLLLKLSFPAMAGMIIYSLFSLADTFFVARLGSMSLAALSFSIPIQVFLVSIASATGVGLTSSISRALGAGNYKLADNIAWHGVLLSIIYGFFSIVIARYYLNDLLVFTGCTPEIFLLIKEYLEIILYGSFFIFLPIMLSNVIQGEGNTLWPMTVALAGILINVALDPLLIFGYGPVKAMGLNGSALATIYAQAVCSFLVIMIARKSRGYLSWQFNNFRFKLVVFYKIFQVGFPTIIMELTGVFVMLVLNKILAGFGNNAIAVLGIFLRLRSFFYMPVYGLTQGVMPIAGFAFGGGSFDRVKEVFLKSSVLSVVFTGIAFYAMQFKSSWLLCFFSHDAALISLGVICMQLGTIFIPFMGPIVILHTVLQAIGKGATAMWFSLIRHLVFFFPFLLILPEYIGINGVWAAFSISELLSLLLSVPFFISLWRELQLKNKISLITLSNPGYLLKRTLAWLKFDSF